MRKLAAFTMICFGCLVSATVSADQAYDYDSVEAIVVRTEIAPFAYAKFQAFVELRNLIAKSMKRKPEQLDNQEFLYEMRMINDKGLQTIFVSEKWISDGEQRFAVERDAFERIDALVKHRINAGVIGRKLEESEIDDFLVFLRQQAK